MMQAASAGVPVGWEFWGQDWGHRLLGGNPLNLVSFGFRQAAEEEEEEGVSFIGPLDSFQESGCTFEWETGSRTLGRDKHSSLVLPAISSQPQIGGGGRRELFHISVLARF